MHFSTVEYLFQPCNKFPDRASRVAEKPLPFTGEFLLCTINNKRLPTVNFGINGCYQAGFGVFNSMQKNSAGLFEHDLIVLMNK